ncbi:hypothetical protein ASPBRDRAFT_200978 [Aspergillus brasiliensis CBS 101740]|uniref:Uncharacterized protein n=1 Tax=Aspergillus brasiliensis (strain CBS 101740 / IMI 381727 / IBT 21946) TaxID=767769 RepID=A0A1L9U3W3_ASPBC|nr:hypothetical protein ASPBRDRAFT_200978 [Aspergillus brasiliensis CBS 101740]
MASVGVGFAGILYVAIVGVCVHGAISCIRLRFANNRCPSPHIGSFEPKSVKDLEQALGSNERMMCTKKLLISKEEKLEAIKVKAKNLIIVLKISPKMVHKISPEMVPKVVLEIVLKIALVVVLKIALSTVVIIQSCQVGSISDCWQAV